MKANILLLITAALWGTTFVAQRAGMDHIGPFYYTGLRFLMGAIVLIPLLYLNRKNIPAPPADRLLVFKAGIFAGCAMFMGIILQQTGLVYTSAGNAGFITGLYIIAVPFLSVLLKKETGGITWIGTGLALAGLYLLSVSREFTMQLGDFLVLISVFFWAVHIHIIGFFSRKTDPLQLAFLQFLFCGGIGTLAGFFLESLSLQILQDALIPLLYGGIISVGIAFTLQVIAQRDANPNHAALIMSLEAVFAALGGWMVLGEEMPIRKILACCLMFAGIITSQLKSGGRITPPKPGSIRTPSGSDALCPEKQVNS